MKENAVILSKDSAIFENLGMENVVPSKTVSGPNGPAIRVLRHIDGKSELILCEGSGTSGIISRIKKSDVEEEGFVITVTRTITNHDSIDKHIRVVELFSKVLGNDKGCLQDFEDDEIVKITRELIATDEPISTSTRTYNVSPTGMMKLATKEVIKWSYPELPKEVEETKDGDNVETVTAEVVGVEK